MENIFIDGHFSFIGSNGWYKRGQTKAVFDQQPIEAVGTILMLKDIYEVTKNSRYLILLRKAFNWFFGENDLHIPVYNFITKGCHDGLTPDGVNANQGAESILSFLLSLLAVNGSYAAIEKVTKSVQSPEKAVRTIAVRQIKKVPTRRKVIKSFPDRITVRNKPLKKSANLTTGRFQSS